MSTFCTAFWSFQRWLHAWASRPRTAALAATRSACAVSIQQEGRPQRSFEATLDDSGGIATTAIVGGGNKMNVVGSVQEGAAKIKLDGYCVFEGALTKK